MDIIDFKEGNNLKLINSIIKKTLEVDKFINIILFEEPALQKIFIMNIMTIIEMKKEYNNHYGIKNELLDKLYKKIITNNNLNYIQNVLQDNIQLVNDILREYYLSRNYIYKKVFYEVMLTSANKKEMLKRNPFFINNHMEYFCNKRISEEEKIINNIIEYYIQAIRITQSNNTERNLKLTIDIIKKKHKNDIMKHMLFIISNTYQEIKENSNDLANPYYQKFIKTIENNSDVQLKCDEIINNEDAMIDILKKFIIYNLRITPTRLDDLTKKESYHYVKKIYPYKKTQ